MTDQPQKPTDPTEGAKPGACVHGVDPFWKCGHCGMGVGVPEGDGRNLPTHAVMWLVVNDRMCRQLLPHAVCSWEPVPPIGPVVQEDASTSVMCKVCGGYPHGARPAEGSPVPEATHRCKVCGALWRLNPPTKVQPDGSWSLVYPSVAGKCCDNVAMGSQIEVIGTGSPASPSGLPKFEVSDSVPPGEIHFRNQDGSLAGKIVALEPGSLGVEAEAEMALNCLYIVVEKHVADDVNAKIRAALSSLRGERERLQKTKDGMEVSYTVQVARLEHKNQELRARAKKTLAWADTEITATRASEARMLRRLEDSGRALDSAREALRQIAERPSGSFPAVDNPYKYFHDGYHDMLHEARAAMKLNAPLTPSCVPLDMCPDCTITIVPASAPPAPAPAPPTGCDGTNNFVCTGFPDHIHGPAQREDAPTPEKPMTGSRREREAWIAKREAAPDLEGLIRETRDRIVWWIGWEGDPGTLDPLLRTMASEVARLTREPLEKDLEEVHDEWAKEALAAERQLGIELALHTTTQKLREEAERKLAEVTRERDAREAAWGDGLAAARRDTWEKAIKAQCSMCANGSVAVRRNSVTYIHNLTTDDGPYICNASRLHAARAQEDALSERPADPKVGS